MPLNINITNTAAHDVQISKVQDPNYDDLWNIYVTGVTIANFMPTGTYFKLAVTHPTYTTPVTNVVNSIAGGTGSNGVGGDTYTFPGHGSNGNLLIATVATDRASALSLQYQFKLQSSTSLNGTYTDVSPIVSGTQYTLVLTPSGTVNDVVQVAYDATLTAGTLQITNTGGSVAVGQTATIDSVDYVVQASAGSFPGVNYILTLPASNAGSVVVDIPPTLSIAATAPVDVAATSATLDQTVSQIAGTNEFLNTQLKWSRMVFRSVTVGGTTTPLAGVTSFVPGNAITLDSVVNGNGTLLAHVKTTAGVTASNISITNLQVAVN